MSPQQDKSQQTTSATGKQIAKISRRSTAILTGGALVALTALLATRCFYADLTDSYIICTKNGGKIYTVDTQNSVQRCLGVHATRVFATGDLGKREMSYSDQC